ncbi:MAG: Flp family type IVb pilin [Nocardioides sp.]|uniref:Flp family type IVb pilin n=1 Tax=Nocardioides nematodiphilus TaxID=2849669 RepID=UPI001CDA27CA|nr:Flp family type IVb pilin [Nocardioides nematodiphilus]MCA1983956.1 Flp family type IVb pilin [Nocardioides nematodiphilus]
MLNYLNNMFTMRRRDNDRGASAVEYGLLVAGIAAVIVAVVFTFGGKIKNIFDDTCQTIAANGTAPAAGTNCT